MGMKTAGSAHGPGRDGKVGMGLPAKDSPWVHGRAGVGGGRRAGGGGQKTKKKKTARHSMDLHSNRLRELWT